MIKYLNLGLRGSLILPVDPHRSSLDILNILLRLHRTVFTVFWWWNSTPLFPDASRIPKAECMILNSMVKKRIWVSNALLITALAACKPNAPRWERNKSDQNNFNDPNAKQEKHIFPEFLLGFLLASSSQKRGAQTIWHWKSPSPQCSPESSGSWLLSTLPGSARA